MLCVFTNRLYVFHLSRVWFSMNIFYVFFPVCWLFSFSVSLLRLVVVELWSHMPLSVRLFSVSPPLLLRFFPILRWERTDKGLVGRRAMVRPGGLWGVSARGKKRAAGLSCSAACLLSVCSCLRVECDDCYACAAELDVFVLGAGYVGQCVEVLPDELS